MERQSITHACMLLLLLTDDHMALRLAPNPVCACLSVSTHRSKRITETIEAYLQHLVWYLRQLLHCGHA